MTTLATGPAMARPAARIAAGSAAAAMNRPKLPTPVLPGLATASPATTISGPPSPTSPNETLTCKTPPSPSPPGLGLASRTLPNPVPPKSRLARAGAGDGAAAAALLDRLGPRLMAFCLRMTGGDRAQAENVMQDAFLRLWKRADDWDAGGAARLSTWLGRVAANLAVDAGRRARRMRPMDNEVEVADGAPSAVAGLIRAERLSALDAALATLPERQRQAVVLRHIEGYSNPDIAAMLGCGVEAVESLMARAKRRLAEILRDEGGTE